ncbi:MAG TPA: NAD/NADP octopine/nopaline dehydrogenase family protein [Casimicrobiaceae bacterium]|nr:NAD/NADP octopine/nopaline dehydrogenase family protein [Casimicrobiaceae bacterium]
MQVAIVGAGAIARAYAVLLSRDGHRVSVWSPSGHGARDVAGGRVTASGLVEGTYAVSIVSAPESICGAEVVLVALPATAYAAALPRVAPHLRTGQTVFVSGALSLSPLWLAELAAGHGRTPTVAASGTTVATARTRPGGVAVNAVRTRIGIAALPTAASDAALATMRALFGGDRFDSVASVLAVTLANINPVAHAAIALCNLTRMEYGEAWPQYHYLTPAVARLVAAMDAERQAIASAFGLTVAPIEAHFQRSFDVAQDTLAQIAAELHRRRGGPPGPASLDTRFVLEDVPFGLVCNEALARVAGVSVPSTAATITVHCDLYGQDFRGENSLIAELGLRDTSPATLLARCEG